MISNASHALAWLGRQQMNPENLVKALATCSPADNASVSNGAVTALAACNDRRSQHSAGIWVG